ncbi:RNA-binding protein [Candidatus Bathyarchaeota archaeon]|nr:RNA-binding protein [Candidatus Bathyarchaeota archaeon]
MHRKRISVAVPASVVSDTPHLREKTSKIGLIGRAAAIFGVSEIIIYCDEPKKDQKADMNLIATILRYMEAPQYLRKRLFKLMPELRYAGILPPLRTPHHPLGGKITDLKLGEYREGITLSTSKKGTLVDIGAEKPALIPEASFPSGKRITVKITHIGKKILVAPANRQEIPEYWGYTVTCFDGSLGKLLSDKRSALKIATSKYGKNFNEIRDNVAEKWRKSEEILILFGAPTRGLYEIARHEGMSLETTVDFVVNTIPRQCTETVRTEEALIASLAVFNISLGFNS